LSERSARRAAVIARQSTRVPVPVTETTSTFAIVVVKAKTQQYANANAPRTSVAHRDPHPDKTGRRTTAEIEQIVSEYESSGLNRSQFCRGHGLTLGVLNRLPETAACRIRGWSSRRCAGGGGIGGQEAGREAGR
jgi:hypothetical protein